jgi:hypothetical protein
MARTKVKSSDKLQREVDARLQVLLATELERLLQVLDDDSTSAKNRGKALKELVVLREQLVKQNQPARFTSTVAIKETLEKLVIRPTLRPSQIRARLESWEKQFQLAKIPERENGVCRLVDLLLMGLAKGTAKEHVSWVHDNIVALNVDGGLKWKKAKKLYVQHFGRGSDVFTETSELQKLKQNLKTVEDFSMVMADLVTQSLMNQDGAPHAAEEWKIAHPIYTQFLIYGLNEVVRTQLLNEPKFMKSVSKGWDSLVRLAIKVEKHLDNVGTFVKEQAKISKAPADHKKDQHAQPSKEGKKRKRDKDAKEAYEEPSSRVACTRCKRVHKGGAAACIAATHLDGHRLDGKAGQPPTPMATTTCFTCGQPGHKAWACPKKPPSKIQRIGQGGGDVEPETGCNLCFNSNQVAKHSSNDCHRRSSEANHQRMTFDNNSEELD